MASAFDRFSVATLFRRACLVAALFHVFAFICLMLVGLGVGWSAFVEAMGRATWVPGKFPVHVRSGCACGVGK
jgi:hypothetical protein